MLNQIKQEVEAGRVNATRHPTLPLTLFKYTKSCTYGREWNDINLKCRGLVLDDDGQMVINSMPKFFNNFEPRGQETLEKNHGRPYVVTDKYDGSLINFTLYKGELLVCSSGSFISAQAQKARELIEGSDMLAKMEPGLTYCAEIIYPENKIVLDYGDRVSLDVFNIRDNKFDAQFRLAQEGKIPSLSFVIKDILADLPRKDFINKEGFILTFDNGDRVKFKYDEYMRLHKIVSGINEKFIWESMRDGAELPLENLPDELYAFIDETKATLGIQFDELHKRATLAMDGAAVFETRKDKALFLKQYHPEVAGLVFGSLDGRDISPEIWKRIEPKNTRTGMGEATN